MVTKKIKLKIWENNYVTLHTEKGEVDSRYIEVAFKDEHLNNLNLTGKNVTFFAQKPDKSQIFNVCTVNTTTNTATIELTSEALDTAGVMICEFQIFDSNNVLLKVGGLRIIVDSVIDFNEAAESSSSPDVITVIMSSIGNLSLLTTTNKSSLVGAINELDSKVIPISNGGTGATTATAARTNLEVLKQYSLYSNSSGTSSTITLPESAANYVRLDITFIGGNGLYFTQEIYDADNKNTFLIATQYNKDNGVIYIKSSKISFSGTSLTFSPHCGYLRANSSGNTTTNEQTASITKVVGYKY